MSETLKPPIVIDPQNVPEIMCDGQFNLSVSGPLAKLTFTQNRPDATALFRDGTMDIKGIVCARIVLATPNLVALRDLLNRIVLDQGIPIPPAGGAKH